MESPNPGPENPAPETTQHQPETAVTQAADAAAPQQEGATNMAAEKKTRKKDENATVVRISGDAAVALQNAIDAATKKSGFKPRAAQVIEAALLAYAK